MIVLVPVSRFRVKYELAVGYPYSQLERLVLQSIGEGLASIDDLVNTFQLHPRLLIQSLVGLTHAGWIALGGSQAQQFVLTPQGQRALEKGQIPESIAVIPRQTYVLLERVTGSVIPEGEAQYISRRDLEKRRIWGNCSRLRAEVLDSKLDESQVQHLLPRQQGHRLRWVGPIEMVSKGDHYIPVDIDLEREAFVNLPPRCETLLRPYVVDKAKEELRRGEEENESILNWEDLIQTVKLGRGRVPTVAETSGLPPRDWPVQWSSNDLLYSPDQHIRLLYQVLEKANTSVYIASRLAQLQHLEQLKPAIIDALKRGVDVDLLWGYANDQECLSWMKKLAYDTKSDNVAGKLRFNREPSFSNAKIMLWDEAENTFRGVVGSYDWLSSSTSDKQFESRIHFSVVVSHSAILSGLSWSAAALWSRSHSEGLSSVPDKWRRIAASLEAQTRNVSGYEAIDPHQATMRLVLDREHSALLREFSPIAQVRLIIASGRLDANAERLLLPVREQDRAPEFIHRVLFGQSDINEESLAPVRNTVEQAGGTLRCVPRLGANVIVSDQLSCISSFSFLSQSYPKKTSPREVGLVIEGTEPANQIAGHLLGAVSD